MTPKTKQFIKTIITEVAKQILLEKRFSDRVNDAPSLNKIWSGKTVDVPVLKNNRDAIQVVDGRRNFNYPDAFSTNIGPFKIRNFKTTAPGTDGQVYGLVNTLLGEEFWIKLTDLPDIDHQSTPAPVREVKSTLKENIRRIVREELSKKGKK